MIEKQSNGTYKQEVTGSSPVSPNTYGYKEFKMHPLKRVFFYIYGIFIIIISLLDLRS